MLNAEHLGFTEEKVSVGRTEAGWLWGREGFSAPVHASVGSTEGGGEARRTNGVAEMGGDGKTAPRMLNALKIETPSWSLKAKGTVSSMTTPRSARTESGSFSDSHELKFCSTNFFELADKMRNEMDVRDRLVGLKSVPKCVLATEIVKWLMANGECDNTNEAIFLGAGLVEHGHIYAANEEDGEVTPFENKTIAYRFASDDRNMSIVLKERDVMQICKDFDETITGRTLKVGVVKIPDAVYASDITDWLIASNYSKNRGEAVNVAQMLLDRGAFHRPNSGDIRFKDGKVVYKLGSPVCWHNGEMVTISRAHTANATRSRAAESPRASTSCGLPERTSSMPRSAARSVTRTPREAMKSPLAAASRDVRPLFA